MLRGPHFTGKAISALSAAFLSFALAAGKFGWRTSDSSSFFAASDAMRIAVAGFLSLASVPWPGHSSPMKHSPPPHQQPQSLAELLSNAEHYARYCMDNSGSITPALFFLAPEGQGMAFPDSLASDEAKDEFANLARLTCVAHAASACVMVLEAWAKFARPNEPLDTTEPPSEAIDRQEFVILMGESRSGNRRRFLPIIRSDNGKFFGFGDPQDLDADMQGRFATILPPKDPDTATRAIAKALLQIKIEKAQPGKTSRPPRSRE